MAFSNFIPEIWSARLLEHMDKVHVYANLMNRDYEGDIKAYGDTVHINLLGEITINDDLQWECPVCHNTDQAKMNVTRRTCGYLGENYWNVGKTKEIKSRVLHL